MSGSEIPSVEKPKWLQHLQENSWEAEILISGGAIFSLLHFGDSLSDYSIYLKDVRGIQGHNLILILLLLGINGITLGFFAHLALRGYWIGLVCINYASPNGINYARLKVSEVYLKESKSVNLINQIIALDKFSGQMFFLSLSFLLVVIGFTLVSGISLMLSSQFDFSENIYFGLCLVFYLDFISSGLLRRFKVIGWIYRPLYIYFNYLSLAFIYRPWFQIVFTNSSRWKVLIGMLAFLITSLFFTISSASRTLHFGNFIDARMFNLSFDHTRWSENFYESRTPDGVKIELGSIQSDLVSENYLRIFIPYKIIYDELILSRKAMAFEKIVVLKIDGEEISEPGWLSGTRMRSNQQGITCITPIEQLVPGKHTLTIEMEGGTHFKFPLSIPFWKL